MLSLGPKIQVLPVIHGSGDCALETRRVLLEQRFDLVAVPLPPSFQRSVEEAILKLPTPQVVAQAEPLDFGPRRDRDWNDGGDLSEGGDLGDGDGFDSGDGPRRTLSFVPIDPCQPVIMALRVALGEHVPRAFIDLETARFHPVGAVLPDPYALKRVALERFAAALLPSIPRPPRGQPQARVAHMAARLRALESRHERILLVCSVLDWPWIREAYTERAPVWADDDEVEPTVTYRADPRTLIFLLGELPFITALYERARAELESDENLSVDGVKELLLAARTAYRAEYRKRARKLTPHLMSTLLKYVRNLSLLERRFTPDLYTLVVASKQVAGDAFALHVAETAREYALGGPTGLPTLKLGVDRGQLPDGEVARLVSRLPGPPVVWRGCKLTRRPDRREVEKWGSRWNPFQQCSWPPEDELIENFRAHVINKALSIMGADLARTEKFTTSVMDGIDIRDTLRHWHEGDIYVKILPPNRGRLDCVVMLFDSPADPREYPWRTTWYAEHQQESTLAFFATDFGKQLVGPGIAQAIYGGAMFLFPPAPLPDIWTDRRLDFTETLEERLLAAACLHSQQRQIALLSPAPPGSGWRRLAKRWGKTWVHVPLQHFSDATVQQLRVAHVLNGKQVRSYAEKFIRRV